MRVESRPATAPAGPAAAGRRTAGAAFQPETGATQARGTGAAAPASVLGGLDALLALQGQDDAPAERRRRSVARGHDLLDGLDRLKAALLGGRVAADELATIAQRLTERAHASGDPRLDGLVAEIELRAAVELAKLEVARSAGTRLA